MRIRIFNQKQLSPYCKQFFFFVKVSDFGKYNGTKYEGYCLYLFKLYIIFFLKVMK